MTFKLELQNKIDQKTKPLGALGRLEKLAFQIGSILETLTPEIVQPTILIFAADHGIAQSGVSAYPQSVTAQMVLNFLNGGAAINVFARQHDLNLKIIDAGVNADLSDYDELLHAKMAYGTQNFLNQPAMSVETCERAIHLGAETVQQIRQTNCNCIGLGEMGIGNTASAAVLMHLFTKIPLRECVGRGTGLNDEQLQHKQNVLQQAIEKHSVLEPLGILATFGGFEIAMMVGAYLQAAELKMLILVDGFVTCAALLVAAKMKPDILKNCIFSHVGSENGHRALLDFLDAKPLLDLEMRLGEGSGIALAYPLIQSTILFLNEMATFEEAGVDKA